MHNLLATDIFEGIVNIIGNIGLYLKFEYLLYIIIGLQVLFVIYFLIRTNFTYELRLLRSVDKLNVYLLKNQFLNENNLVDFNKKIKTGPKTLRYHWQQYMLYREQDPSKYMSTYNCIEKPAKSSVFKEKIKNFIAITCFLAIFAFIIGCGYCRNYFSANGSAAGTTSILYIYMQCFIIPAILFLIAILFVMYLRARLNVVTSDLYQNFQVFERLIDKAATTIPEYVDYEVLFTKKEIKKGIPVLNEYLEKRVRQEQAELEKARQNAIQSEKYDFSNFNIDGSLVLERAMKESEIYLSIKNRLNNECTQIENEIENAKKSFEIKQKDFERKLQVSRENMDRLKQQQESSTNRIESNYIRKQQADEAKKQQTIEKDLQDAENRYNQEITALNQEIETRKQEIEERRKFVETAMSSEFKNFSIKVYKEVDGKIDEQKEDEKDRLISEITRYKKEVKDKIEEEEKLNKLLLEKTEEIGRLKAELGILKNDDVSDKLKSEALSNLKNNKIANKSETETETIAGNKYDEFGGYYNNEGYYIYQNGTYYDPNGNYWDLKGGYYDPDGNYHYVDENGNEIDENQSKENSIDVVDENAEKNIEKAESEIEAEQRLSDNKAVESEIELSHEDENQIEENNPENLVEGEDALATSLADELVDQSSDEVEEFDDEEIENDEEPETYEDVEEQVDDENDNEIENEIVIEEKPAPKKRGRKKGSKNSITKTPLKKYGKRGRPSKSRIKKLATDDSDNGTQQKRGRGRPRKEEKKDTLMNQPVKRGRGRPRKQTIQEQVEPTVKRGRGRPRLQKNNTQPTLASEEDLTALQQQLEQQNENLIKSREELKSKLEETLARLEEQDN